MSENQGFLKKFALYIPVKLIPALLTVGFIFFLYRYFPVGDYALYSLSVACSLIVAQLSVSWVGNSFIYLYSVSESKVSLFFSCLLLVFFIAPFSALLVSVVMLFVSNGEAAALLVCVLCVTQVLFFFMSSVCQAKFMVAQQLVAVIIQAFVQIALMLALYGNDELSYQDAIIAVGVGYGCAAFYMLASVVKGFNTSCCSLVLSRFRSDVSLIYTYGSALTPWLLGVLVMAAADRFAIGRLEVSGGDAYLSLKDLFVGAGGLLSMPLLMLVHPLVIKRFRAGAFDGALIQSSMSFLVLIFSLMWIFLFFVGFPVFVYLTGKPLDVSVCVLLVAYIGVFLNCASVYLQKRLEVHRKIRFLAFLSLICSLISVLAAYIGAIFFGLLGAAFGALVGQLIYVVVVGGSLVRKVSFYYGGVKPFVIAMTMFFLGWLLSAIIKFLFMSMAWWVWMAVWFFVFGALSLIVLWRFVVWSDFTSARL